MTRPHSHCNISRIELQIPYERLSPLFLVFVEIECFFCFDCKFINDTEKKSLILSLIFCKQVSLLHYSSLLLCPPSLLSDLLTREMALGRVRSRNVQGRWLWGWVGYNIYKKYFLSLCWSLTQFSMLEILQNGNKCFTRFSRLSGDLISSKFQNFLGGACHLNPQISSYRRRRSSVAPPIQTMLCRSWSVQCML